jgi:CHAT domain-containing protein
LLKENAVRKVVVVPHLWLHSVPFWATPALAPYDVLMASSAAQFVRARRREPATIQGSALIVSNPTADLPVSGAEAESVSLRLRRMGLQTSRLPNGGEATEDAITSALASGVSVFHFSGHGRSDLFQATRSALLLHPAVEQGEPQSGRFDALVASASEWHEDYEDFRWADVPGVGRLYERRWPESQLVERTLDYSERGTLWAQYDGEDIVTMAELWSAGDIMVGEVLTGCALAVLSACESGSAQLSGTVDEYAGLPAAIGLAGATTVVSTLWPIDDALTALHVDLLYEALTKSTGEIDVSHTVREVGDRIRSLPRAEAVDLVENLRQRTTDPIGRLFLERFRRDLERGAEYPFARPYEWATFYVTGGGKILVTHDDQA